MTKINEPAGNNAEKHLLQEYEYSGYLSATAFRNLPQAVAIGNHDCLTTSYQNHFNVPNPFTAELILQLQVMDIIILMAVLYLLSSMLITIMQLTIKL